MNTTYFTECILGNVFGVKTDVPLPSTYYMGLSSSVPSVDGTCTGEPLSKAGYARVDLVGCLAQPENGIVKNNQDINFNESLSDWGVMTHYVVYDSEVGGNLLFFGELSMKRTIEPYTVLNIAAGELIIELRNIS